MENDDEKRLTPEEEMDRIKSHEVKAEDGTYSYPGLDSPNETDAEKEAKQAELDLQAQRIALKKFRVFKNLAKEMKVTPAKVLFAYINQMPEAKTLFLDEVQKVYWFAPIHEKIWKELKINRFQYYSIVNKLIEKGLIFKTKFKGMFGKDVYTINFVMLDTEFEDEEFKPGYQEAVKEELKAMEETLT